MPSESLPRDDEGSETPVFKRRKTAASPLLATPARVLSQIQNGDTLDTGRVLQALCNAVISSSVDEDEDPHALKLLAELLAEDGVDPNAGDEALWDNYGGSPLYQACALDLPFTAKALLDHGASVVQVYKGQTPLQAALAQKKSRCVKVIMEHIEKLETQAREGRGGKGLRRSNHGSQCER
ncbi:unnamed protein product [Ectocarpus sp. 12 AP-2014]